MTATDARRPKGLYLLPNLLTSGSLFAGFYCIVAAINGRWEGACMAIAIAALLDNLDGRIARLTNTQSDFGVQYDSLSDLISFGLAPALLIYTWSLKSLGEINPVMGRVGWLAAFVFAACAALRLARFNTQAGVADKRYFQGLSSPAAAGVLITLVWVLDDYGVAGADVRYVALALTLIAALLMVSNVRYISFKSSRSGGGQIPFFKGFLLLVFIVLLALDPSKVLAFIAYAYLISGPILTLVGRRKLARRGGSGRQRVQAEEKDSDGGSEAGSEPDEEGNEPEDRSG